jgi:hypothetical protein
MLRRAHYRRDPDWAESKVMLVIHAFLAWGLADNTYDTLIKGCPIYRIFGGEGGGTYDALQVGNSYCRTCPQ